MANNIEAYKKQFQPETIELIVRVQWCWKRGCSEFSLFDDHYKASIHFVEALNVQTGEMIQTGINIVEWLAPKKSFGFKYGYKFKRGVVYRLLVRKYIPKENETFRKYYLEQVLEKDVKDTRLDPRYNFEQQFEEEVTELTVLIKKRICGWVVDLNYKKPAVTFLASIDSKTNLLDPSYGRLVWMEKEKSPGIRFNFDTLGTYRVRVRKSKEKDRYYWLLDAKKVKDDRFEGIREAYLKPVVIHSEQGELKLNREYDRFEGELDYLGEKSIVYIYVEEGSAEAELQLRKLNEVFLHLAEWDNKVREYASAELLESANEWCCDEEETEITKEEFIRRIGTPMLNIYEEGTMTVMFDSDEMFTDHGIVIHIDENGELKDAGIEG